MWGVPGLRSGGGSAPVTLRGKGEAVRELRGVMAGPAVEPERSCAAAFPAPPPRAVTG